MMLYVTKKLGIGHNTSFWHDSWIESMPLKMVYILYCFRLAWIKTLLWQNREGWLVIVGYGTGVGGNNFQLGGSAG
jgi:hypothetical protein